MKLNTLSNGSDFPNVTFRIARTKKEMDLTISVSPSPQVPNRLSKRQITIAFTKAM